MDLVERRVARRTPTTRLASTGDISQQCVVVLVAAAAAAATADVDSVGRLGFELERRRRRWSGRNDEASVDRQPVERHHRHGHRGREHAARHWIWRSLLMLLLKLVMMMLLNRCIRTRIGWRRRRWQDHHGLEIERAVGSLHAGGRGGGGGWQR